MQQPGQHQAPDPASFAGLLCSLAGSRADVRGPRPDSPGWDDDLEDDVATFSYQRDLKAQASYELPAAPDWPLSPAADANTGSCADAPVAAASKTGSEEKGGASAAAAVHANSAEKLQQSGKLARVTIRMSRQEFAQLQLRATEAGLTVSAYLRSCTFEVETLRAEVKQALAEFRAAQPASQFPAPWWRRILHGKPKPASA